MWVKVCTAALVLTLLACGASTSEKAAALQGPAAPESTLSGVPVEHPNVVLVLADDLDTAPFKRFPTAFPNITALAERGVSFEDAFAVDPLCCPSRATLLSGLYSHNHGVWDNAPPQGGWDAFRDEEPEALPVQLDAAGYESGLYGRYLNKYDGSEIPPGWDKWGAVPLVNDTSPARMEGYGPDGRNTEGRTHTQVLAEEAAGFVQESSSAGKPFFLHVTPYAPHAPWAHPAEYDKLFAGERAPRNPAFDEADVSDKPPWVSRQKRLSAVEKDRIDTEYRERLRSTKDLDDMVGRIVGTLRDVGELDDTYVLFTSDHGYHLGQHRLKPGKWTPYGHDARVPLIVAGPGVPAGETREGLIGNHDFAPTVADLAGTKMPRADGSSFAPLFSDPSFPWRSALLIESAANSWNKRPAYRAVRTQRYLYVRYGDGKKELYDGRTDPYQVQSRPGLPAARWLDNRLDSLVGCSDAFCHAAEGPIVP
jgi:arylsulfatase A-like enzyme